MLKFFRDIFKTKVGAGIAIAVLVLIALAFTSGDVANTGGFGGIAGGDRVAMVGGERIDTATLQQAATNAVERRRQEDPSASMQTFLATGGLEQVLNDLISRLAVAVFGRENGLVASDRLIDSEIAQIPSFRGPDGNFSQDVFRQALAQQGISEALVRDDLEQGLIARQVLLPASFGAKMPRSLAQRYATLLRETRRGSIAVLPSLAFVEQKEPTAKQISDYYARNRNDFIRPERRTIRYATFGADVIANVPAPTESEIAFRYRNNAQQYAARERRRVTQVIFPTEAAARAIIAEVRGGKTLETAAQQKGLAATSLELMTKAEFSDEYSPQAANAVFGAQRGALAGPARSPLGWQVMRVEEIDRQEARSLADVRDELAEEIASEKRRVALTETLEAIEDAFDSGESLADVARTYNLELETTGPLLSDGSVYESADGTAPEAVAPVLANAFSMEAQEPQVAETERGTRFIIYDVSDIAESAAAPLAEIRQDVRSAYILDRASQAAKAAAEKVQAAVKKGTPLAEALRAVGKRLPPPQQVSMTRPELARMQQNNQEVPRPLALMFNMAAGTVKVQPAPNDQGWFVVSLREIEPGKVADDDPMIDGARGELGQVLATEYTDALGRAIRAQVGVERNSDGIRAVREALGGSGAGN